MSGYLYEAINAIADYALDQNVGKLQRALDHYWTAEMIATGEADMSHKFGWCLDGHHESCRGSIVRYWDQGADPQVVVCACECHSEAAEVAA